MTRPLRLLAVATALAAPMATPAQTCAPLFREIGLATDYYTSCSRLTLTMMSLQANGISAYSGARPLNPGSPQYESHLYAIQPVCADRSYIPGLMQASDRQAPQIDPDQAYSVEPGLMDSLYFFLDPSSGAIYVYDATWGNSIVIPSPRCENGIIWGLGDPIGNLNGENRALYMFSYGFTGC